MGAWGVGSFENDDAEDFLVDAMADGDVALLREVFDNVVTSTEYVEASDACRAIVAGEMVAAARGRSSVAAQGIEGLPDWLAGMRREVDASLAAQAANALEPGSELSELWEESANFQEWQATVTELRQQLLVRH